MAKITWLHQIAWMLVVILISGCTNSVAEGPEGQHAASALFADHFETVFYTNADLLSSSAGYKKLSRAEANLLRAPFGNLLQALDPMGRGASIELLKNSDAVLVGAKDFRSPQGPPPHLGGVQSHFSAIFILDRRSSFEIGKMGGKLQVMSSAGNGVWKWSGPSDEGHPQSYTFYAIQTAHSYVLISNDMADIRAMTTLLSSSTVPDLSGLPGWVKITRHGFWGYRRYTHQDRDKTAAGTNLITPSTKALAVFAEPNKKTVVLQLFSSTSDTANQLNATNMVPSLRSDGNGTWQTIIPLTEKERTIKQMLAVLSWFGFGVYL